MITNDDKNESSFLDEEANTNYLFSLKDLLQIFLHNLHWFVICAVLGGLIAAWYVKRQDHFYASSAKVLIKDPGSSTNDLRDSELLNNVMNSKTGVFSLATLTNEMIIMTSKTTIEKVVRNLDLNIVYTARTKMVHRVKDLYGESPVNVSFCDLDNNAQASLVITPKDSSRVEIVMGADAPPFEAALRDTLRTSLGRIIVKPTVNYYESCYGVPVTVTHRSLSNVVASYRRAVQVTREDQIGSVVNLSLRDLSPQRAADVLNELIRVYNDDAVNDKIRVIDSSYEFINNRLQAIDSDLSMHERAVAAFKRENKVIDTRSLGENYMSASLASSEKIKQLERQLTMANYLKDRLSSSTDDLLPVGVGLDDSDIVSTIAEYNDIRIKLDVYDKKNGQDNNPVVKDLRYRIQSYRSSLQNMLSGYIATVRNSLELAYNDNSSAADDIGMVPEKQVYLADLERVQRIKETVYITLLNKREQMIASQPSIVGNAKIIDEARADFSPVSPNDRRSILIGILLGLLVPVLIKLLVTVLDTKVRFREDIERYASVPIIGEVPQKDSGDKREIVVEQKSRDLITEAFRILRPNLEYFVDKSKGSNVCVITSFYENSGKTFVSGNLASSFALAGRKVVLVDLDLRKGTHGHRFSRKSVPGVSDFLAGQQEDISGIIHHDVVAPGVDSIFSGPIPPNPIELLSNKRFELLVEHLRERYEMVLLDTIPLTVSADVEEVIRVVDSSIIVLRANRFDKRQLPALEKIYKSGRFPSLGVILNGVRLEKRKGYGYGYGYGYAYGRGYYGHDYGRGYNYSYGYGYNAGHDSKGRKSRNFARLFGKRK